MVQKNQWSEDMAFLEFLKSFNDKNNDGKIDRAEWNDYYAGVSASVDNDDHFIKLMKACWKLDE